jgi:outer membrane protein assembly factor BamE (lipoprotein component of BamABCDE complex)
MKVLNLILILVFISNCTLNKVVKHHGVHNLKKKNEKLLLLTTSSNDVISNIGYPSTRSAFDNDVWIYIERKNTSSELKYLGRKKLLLNDVLILEFDTKGMLVKKDFLSKNDMNKLVMSKDSTKIINQKDAFIDKFLSSVRQKINDPLGIKGIK